jgi:sigma-B regulation protein RsbU (phosphoserine phosphatase)
MGHHSASLPIAPSPRLLEEIYHTTAALAPLVELALAHVSPEGTHWIVTHERCPCSQHTSTTPACLEGMPIPGRASETIVVAWAGKHAGTILMCWEAGQACSPVALRELIQAALRHVELAQENEALLEELSVGWESLEAVYEISSDLRLLQDPMALLDRITSKAVSFQEGLRAILWLWEAGQLMPAAAKNIGRPPPRPAEQGLIGKVLTERHGCLMNRQAPVLRAPAEDAELEHATSLALAPVVARQRGLGVLAVWREDDTREFDSHTMRLVEALALQAAMVIDNDRLYRESIQNERLRQEIAIGAQIQQTLLLGHPPDDFPHLQIAALTLPSQHVDGDFYEFIRHHDQCLDVIVGDVMGKGLPAALLGAATKNHFLRAIGHLASATRGEEVPRPCDIVASTATNLAKQLMDLDSFVTVCYARFDTRRQHVELVDCGHTRTIHFRRCTGTCQLLHGSNLPLGVLEEEDYCPLVAPFESGDVFLFYSDGITEAQGPDRDGFGEARLADVVQSHAHLPSQDLVDAIRQTVMTFSRSHTFADDFTCVAVKILPGDESVPLARSAMEIASDIDHLGQVRAFVRALVQHPALSPTASGRISMLELAATEAFANIVNHAYNGHMDQFVRMEAAVFDDRIVLQLFDRGRPFDWSAVSPPVFDGSQERGFGVYIMAHVVDVLTYSRDEQRGNCLRLEINLRDNA